MTTEDVRKKNFEVAFDVIEQETGLRLTTNQLMILREMMAVIRKYEWKPAPPHTGTAVAEDDVSLFQKSDLSFAFLRVLRGSIFSMDELHEEAIQIEAWKQREAKAAADAAYRRAGKDIIG